MSFLETKQLGAKLLSWFIEKKSGLIAFSGGVDSSLLLKAASLLRQFTKIRKKSPKQNSLFNDPFSENPPENLSDKLRNTDIDFLADFIADSDVNSDVISDIISIDDSTVDLNANFDFRAVYLDSLSGTQREREQARQLAAELDVPLTVLSSEEFSDADFLRNDRQRCYYCKRSRFAQLRTFANQLGVSTLLEGSHFDDQTDYRPGMKAVREFQLESPLMQLKFGKSEIRRLARYWNLPNADQPSNPCLCTRLAFDLPITSKRLRLIEEGEKRLQAIGCSNFRVRLDDDRHIRLEVQEPDMFLLLKPEIRLDLIAFFRHNGALFVSLDLETFHSGSMNRSLDL